MSDTTDRMLVLLAEHLRLEPGEPNGNMPRHLQDEVAAAHAHWARQRDAWRLLIGVRLVNEALEALDG